MSTPAVYAFINATERDEALKDDLSGIGGTDEILAVASDAGYDFTVGELDAAVSLLTFLKDLWSDDDLREEVVAADGDDAVLEIARRRGYTFGAADLATVSITSDDRALDDGELESVAGGTGTSLRDGGTRIQLDTSTTRQTPKTDFGSMVKKGTSSHLGETSSVAAPFVPGGSVVSAAISGLGSVGG